MPIIVAPPAPTIPEDWPADLPTRAYLGDSDIVLGDTDTAGVRWKWAPTNAWGPKPSPREQVGDRAYGDGQWDATRWYGPRTMPIAGTAYAPDHVTLHAAEQRLRDAVSVLGFIYRITEPGWDGYTTVRQQGDVLWTENSHRHASWSISLYAPDPLIYSSRTRTFEGAFPSRSGGLVWPATWPAVWDSVATSGVFTVLNPGTLPVPFVLTVSGPVSDFTIANPDTGEALTVVNPDGVTLRAGEFMVVDTGRRSVMLNGDASRRSWARGDWLWLPAGASTIAVASTGADPAAGVFGEFRAARI